MGEGNEPLRGGKTNSNNTVFNTRSINLNKNMTTEVCIDINEYPHESYGHE